MDTWTRRRFLLASGGVTAAAMADAALTLSWDRLHREAATRPAALGDRVLVVVTLYGGNDGLNTVIPWSDGTYHSARRELGYSEAEVIRLDDHLGLNPSMTGIKALYDRGQVAIVNGVGYPQPDHSHFRSMDIWQTASPASPVSTGWIGRWLDATGDDPLRAVAVGDVLPMLAIGQRCTAASLAAGPFTPLPAQVSALLTTLGTGDAASAGATQEVARACAAARSADATFAAALADGTGTRTTSGAPSRARATGALDAQLQSVAAAITAKVPTKVWAASMGGFDTHADERGTQQKAWQAVDQAVSRFFAALPGGHHVTMLVHTEFGRRVQANASQGTDHGTAGPVFLLGPDVRGGLHGEYPSLTDLDDGDLKASTDFRAVYGELVSEVLGGDPHAVLDQVPAPVGLLQA